MLLRPPSPPFRFPSSSHNRNFPTQESTYDVTLIDEKDFFEFLIGSVRFFVDEKAITQGTFLHSEYLKRTKIVVARAETVTLTHVEIDSGQRIPFDFLVVSAGSSFAGTSKTLEEKRQWYREQYEDIRAADSVLIAGGEDRGSAIPRALRSSAKRQIFSRLFPQGLPASS